jgi:hypothetical protein
MKIKLLRIILTINFLFLFELLHKYINKLNDPYLKDLITFTQTGLIFVLIYLYNYQKTNNLLLEIFYILGLLLITFSLYKKYPNKNELFINNKYKFYYILFIVFVILYHLFIFNKVQLYYK